MIRLSACSKDSPLTPWRYRLLLRKQARGQTTHR